MGLHSESPPVSYHARGRPRQGVSHREERRQRIEKAMRDTGDGRLAAAECRLGDGAAAPATHRAPVAVPVVEALVAASLAVAIAGSEPDDWWGTFAERLRERRAAASSTAAAEATPVAVEPGWPVPGTPETVVVQDSEDERMVDFAPKGAQAEGEAARLYELLLVGGATAAEAQAKISELFSIPRVTKLIRSSMSLG